MKKFYTLKQTILMVGLFLLSLPSLAQDEVKRDFSLSVGFDPRYGFVDTGLGASLTVPHIQFTWDRTLVPNVGPGRITLGNYFGVSLYEGIFPFNLESDFDPFGTPLFVTTAQADIVTLDLGIRGGYTLNPLVDGKIEPYAGLQYHYYISLGVSQDPIGPPADDAQEGDIDNGGQFAAFFGGRYLFSKYNSAFVELNPGYTTIKVGLTFKKFR